MLAIGEHYSSMAGFAPGVKSFKLKCLSFWYPKSNLLLFKLQQDSLYHRTSLQELSTDGQDAQLCLTWGTL